MNAVREERTCWRDERVSLRHRQWGFDCPALDIDFLMLEYDTGKAAVLVEYKHEDAQIVRVGHPSIQAIIDLANRAGVPAFVTRYADDFSWWHPIPLNAPARELCPQSRNLTEHEWVELLYRSRGRQTPPEWTRPT